MRLGERGEGAELVSRRAWRLSKGVGEETIRIGRRDLVRGMGRTATRCSVHDGGWCWNRFPMQDIEKENGEGGVVREGMLYRLFKGRRTRLSSEIRRTEIGENG